MASWEKKKKVFKMIVSGDTITDATEKYNVSRTMVYHWLEEKEVQDFLESELLTRLEELSRANFKLVQKQMDFFCDLTADSFIANLSSLKEINNFIIKHDSDLERVSKKLIKKLGE